MELLNNPNATKEELLMELASMDNPETINAYIDDSRISINDMLSTSISPEVEEALAEHIKANSLSEKDIQEIMSNPNAKFYIEQMHEGATEEILQEMEDLNYARVIDALVDSRQIQNEFKLNGERHINNDIEIQNIKAEASEMRDEVKSSADDIDRMLLEVLEEAKKKFPDPNTIKEINKWEQNIENEKLSRISNLDLGDKHTNAFAKYLLSIKDHAVAVIKNTTRVITDLGKSMSKSSAHRIMEVTRPMAKYVTEATKEAKEYHKEIMTGYKEIGSEVKNKAGAMKDNVIQSAKDKAAAVQNMYTGAKEKTVTAIDKAVTLNPISKYQRLQSKKDLNRVIINIKNSNILKYQREVENIIIKQEKVVNRDIHFQNKLREKLGMPLLKERTYDDAVKASSLITKIRLKNLQVRILKEQKAVVKLFKESNEITAKQNNIVKDKAWSQNTDFNKYDTKSYIEDDVFNNKIRASIHDSKDSKTWAAMIDSLSTDDKLALLTAASCGMDIGKVIDYYAKSDKTFTEAITELVDKHTDNIEKNLNQSMNEIDKNMKIISKADPEVLNDINKGQVEQKINDRAEKTANMVDLYKKQNSSLQKTVARYTGKVVSETADTVQKAVDDSMIR